MDEELETGTTIDDAIDAFMKSSVDETTLSTEDEDEGNTEVETVVEAEDETEVEDEGDEPEDDTEEDEEDESEPAKTVADDDAEVEYTVDGKAQRVSVKDLKRLAGQEAAITQRSQSLAEQRKAVEVQGQTVAAILKRQYDKAVERATPYKDVDLFVASRDLEPAEFTALRKEMEEANAEVKFLESEATEFLKRSQETQATLLREQAKETLKAINDPSDRFHIPGWNDELYNSIRSHAITVGFDRDDINKLVDPAALKVLHKAYLYDKVQEKTETVKAKIAKAPKRALRKSDTPSKSALSKTATRARQVAAESGDLDDVTAAFLAAQKNT